MIGPQRLCHAEREGDVPDLNSKTAAPDAEKRHRPLRSDLAQRHLFEAISAGQGRGMSNPSQPMQSSIPLILSHC